MPTIDPPIPAEVAAAEDFLSSNGIQVLDRNWRCPHHGIDLVAVDRDTLVAGIVRSRPPTAQELPLAAMDSSQRQLLRNLALAWMVIHGHLYDAIRIDVLGVTPIGADEYSVECARWVG